MSDPPQAGPPPPKKRRTAEPIHRQRSKSADLATNDYEDVVTKLKGTDKELAVKSAKKLKTMLSNSSKIGNFVSHRKNLEDLVSVFSRETGLLGTSMYHEELHKYTISILANCCYIDKTTSTGLQIRRASRSFLDQAVRIFESTTSNIEIRVSTCRLIGNLCNNKDLVTSWLSSNTILFDRIALLLESSNESIVTQCLRIFQHLSNHSFTRVIMLSNGGFYLGKLLAKEERRDEVVKILKVLLKRHRNDLDRQLARSECSAHVIGMFFERERSKKQRRQFVIDLFSNSICIREQMETEQFIEQLLSCSLPEKHRMLAAFSQTAWGRAKLRTSGALDVVVDVFSSSEQIDEKLASVQAFRHFVHDNAGMRHLSENSIFVNTVVRDVQKYVEENRAECEPTVDLDFVRRLKRAEDVSAEPTRQNVTEPVDRLHKDFYSMWSYDTPQTSPRRGSSMSPPYNAPSPSYSFPSSVASSVASSAASSPAARRPSEGILDDLSDVESDNGEETVEKESDAEKKKRQEKSIIEGELWLLTWLAQDDHNLQFLIRPDVVDSVVSYLRSTADPDFRTYRVLRRMATHRTHVYRLLDLEFHVRILTGLCASPCRMLKYAKTCKHCDKCSEHGREILREFASHVDNSYGDAHINSQFTQEDFVHRTKAAIAKIVLVKERIRLAKVPALTELFNALAHVMQNFEELGKMETYERGPSFVSQIIGALSILISGQKIKELCENDMWYFPPEPGQGTCHLVQNPEDVADQEELLHFVDDKNEEIAVAPMKKICENSHYFEGMYSSDFVEKTEGIRTFQIQAESCPSEDFKLFIHLLCNCTATCTIVSSAEQCANLLALSDQFLCPSISEQLCADDGPLRTYLNGRSLYTLLPVALATNAHPTLLDTVYLTLVRFSSSEDVTRGLEAICSNSTVVNTFVTSLRNFLTIKC